MSPNYYAIIPANVRYDKDLTPNAKLLYGEITALCNKEGFCWAGNDYFAELYGKDVVSISRWISSLKSGGFIQVLIDQKATHRRKIYLQTSIQKSQELLTKTLRPLNKIVKCSIYSINNTINTPESALSFTLKNYPSRFEQEFLIEFEKHFKNQDQFNEFLKDFNDEAEMKDKPFESWLIPMLKKYCRKWLAFQARKSKGSTAATEIESGKHLGNAI